LKDLRGNGQQLTVALDGLVDAVINQLITISE
jgi:hypothetical protein